MRLPLCCLLLAFASPALATVPAATSAAEREQFIDQTVITYPQTMGTYTLNAALYDPARIPDGVSLSYRLADAPPGLQFNIFVYPLGRTEEATAVTDAIKEIEGEIRTMEQRGNYRDVNFGDAVDFAVPAGSHQGASDAGAGKGASQDKDRLAPPTNRPPGKPLDPAFAEALKSLALPEVLKGSKRPLSLTMENIPSQSLAYAFYRHLFLISVRATAPAGAMPSASFETLVDRAVKDLVPAMQIENYGSCGSMVVTLDHHSGNKDADAQQGAAELMRELGRIQREGCANKPGPATPTPAGSERQTIVYPAGTWH